VNDQGTADTGDDQLQGGATFEFRLDDGDAVYEPDTDDAPVLATVEATNGFAEFLPPGPGSYWVTESSAPDGLDVAPPKLVLYEASGQNCSVLRSGAVCEPDDDASGGFVLVAMTDSPTNTVVPATGTLPPTDSLVPAGRPGTPRGLPVLLVLLVALSAGALLVRRPNRRS